MERIAEKLSEIEKTARAGMRRLPGKMVRMYRYSLFTAAQFCAAGFLV